MLRTLRSVARFARPVLSPRRRRFLRAANIGDLREIARRRLPGGIFDYIDGGAEDETSLRGNTAAFAGYGFRPRVMRDVSHVDTSVELLGHRLGSPLVFSPTGFTRIAHSQGELAVARVAGVHGLPYALSTLSTRSIEEVAAVTTGPKWFQVYVWRDRGMVRDMLRRAAACGYDTIMITVDTAVLGRRERDVRRGFTLPPKLGPGTLVDGLRHPAWTWDFVRHEPITFANVAGSGPDGSGTAVTLSDFIRLKGVQTVDDAVTAVRRGADGVMLSNHGGRQLDGAPAPVDLVRPVREALGPGAAVICDGGVRRGGDIVKAIALGADACTMGRTYLYGLGAAGEAGVERAHAMLTDELRRAMQLCGVRTIAEITPDLVEALR
ncbi:MAG: alpha-hydroxy-acid oxidizing protein [Actinobacteria bacterium]|nr:alpha-hydroxy-acid oxidizing protein [Actinomycetota bacterium]